MEPCWKKYFPEKYVVPMVSYVATNLYMLINDALMNPAIYPCCVQLCTHISLHILFFVRDDNKLDGPSS